jgi:TPR repeat protein
MAAAKTAAMKRMKSVADRLVFINLRNFAPALLLGLFCFLAGCRDTSPPGEADYRTGMDLFRGRGTDADPVAAFALLSQAADQGHAGALSMTGVMLAEGIGTVRDESRAVELLRRAADQNDATASLNLGNMLLAGRGIDQPDAGEGLRRLGQAAELGQEAAMLRMADLLYFGGPGVDPDQAAARPWLEKLAATGHAGSLNILGAMSEFGQGGTVVDYPTALEFYERAALLDDPRAQNNLGNLLRSGLAGEKDEILAHAWFTLAADRWFAAKQTKAVMDTALTDEQKETSRQLVEELALRIRPRHAPPAPAEVEATEPGEATDLRR